MDHSRLWGQYYVGVTRHPTFFTPPIPPAHPGGGGGGGTPHDGL